MNAIVTARHSEWISCVPETLGSSVFAKSTEQRAVIAETYDTPSQLVKSPAQQFVEAVYTVMNNCAVDGWDGYDAKALSRSAIVNAANFYLTRLKELPIPELTPEPDGEVALEWYGENRSSFSISFGNSAVLSYALVADKKIARGIEPIDSPNLELFKVLAREISKA